MVSPVLYESHYTGGFLVSTDEYLSFDSGFIDNSTGADILFSAGLVVVQNLTGSETTSHGTNVGNGTIGSLSVQTGAAFGAYTIEFTSATAFTVTAPDGDVVGNGVTGTAFLNQIGFTITAGGTAFAAGDGFTFSVTEQNGGWVSWTGGSITTPIGLLFNKVWVQAGDDAKVTIVRRNAEAMLSEVQWDPAVTSSGSVATLQATAIAALAANNVIVR